MKSKTLFSLYLLLISLTFFSFNVNCEEINSWNQLVRKGDRFFKKSDNTPFTGILKNFFPSGSISLIDNFKDGKQHGEFKSFHENGKLSMNGIFKNGLQHGEWTEYHDNGALYWKLSYNNGVEKDGLFRMFHSNGSIMSEVTYGKGKPVSNWVYFDENGKKERIDIYQNGKFFYEKHFK